jgi:chemotaxis protein CheX
MQPNDMKEAIECVIQDIWQAMFELPVRSGCMLMSQASTDPEFLGMVPVSGAWNGVISIRLGHGLARATTMAMLQVPSKEIELADLEAMIGELANVVAGNVKALFPGTTQLGLPIVLEGTDFRLGLPGGHEAAACAFECLSWPFSVRLLQGGTTLAPAHEANQVNEC